MFRTQSPGIAMPGYNPPMTSESVSVNSDDKPQAYKIPPVLWMLFFLIMGYVGLRWTLED